MRLLVTGGREYRDLPAIFDTLDRIAAERKITALICGMALGADCIAATWAEMRGVEVVPFPVSKAEWRRFGNGAGPVRNRRMIVEGKPDAFVAFPGGNGTADMIRQATRAAIERIPLT